MNLLIKNILSPLRMDHWTKNLVLVVGYLFSLFYVYEINLKIDKFALAFFVLCISASSNYLINEYLDKSTDKFHPIKKYRTYVKIKRDKNIYFKYLALVTVSIYFSSYVNDIFFILNIVFLACGIFYNVKPFRLKDIFIIDVILESLNNPLRFLMGWSILMSNYYPPISLILFFWLVGCFLMTMKRYSEYNYLIKYIKPEKYRLSFKNYNAKILFELSLLYCLLSFFFIGIFIIKYKLELIILSPLACILYIRIFRISSKKNSLIMNIEKIYKDKIFVYLVLLGLLSSLILLQFNFPFLEIFKNKELYLINY